MKYTETLSAPMLERKGAVLRIIGDGDSLTLIRFEQQPGAVTPVHSHVHEQVGTCISGKGTLISGGMTLRVKPGVSWVIPGGEPHSFTVDSDGSALIVEAFCPPRVDYLSEAKEP